MKKFLVSTMMFFVFAVGLPLAVEAQSCRSKSRYKRSYAARNYNSRNRAPRYSSYNRRSPRYAYSNGGYSTRRPSFYRRHRNLINIGIGTGAGALIGALVGGKRGAAWGALAGAGGSAIYTYKIRPKQRRYY
ncbi:MAG: hypothetical protein WBD22_02785 [Pyrinomonadaceae bacterium]